MLKQSRFSPARPKARQDAPFPIQRSRLIEILNIPLPGKELFRQLGVGRVAMLRLRFRFAFGLADELFEHPTGVCCYYAVIAFPKLTGQLKGSEGLRNTCSGVQSVTLKLGQCLFRSGSLHKPPYHG